MMRSILLASLALAAALPATGCLPIGGCGGFSGSDDAVYSRNSEMLIICGNGGFVANLSDRSLEGRIMNSTDGTIGVMGDDGSLAFDFVYNTDGTASTPQLGDTAWTRTTLDQTSLDHADVMCSDLESRPWWTQL